MSIVADQRKKNAPQTRPNVASQQQQNNNNNNANKKSSKQSQAQAQPAQPSQSKSSPAPLSTATPTSRSPLIPVDAESSTSSPAPSQRPEIKDREHVPIRGFNTAEVDALLHSSIPPKTEIYKPEQSLLQKSGPWAQKASTMATGKDFWLEFRRQVTTLKKGESINKGG